MNEERGSQVSGVLLAFLVGSLTGAAVALLLAPRSGRETRQLIGEKLREGGDKLREGTEKLREGAEKQRGRLSAAIEAGRQAYREEKDQT